MKSDNTDEVKRIKKVKLYGGSLVSKDKQAVKSEIVGGIAVVYELRNGDEIIDGLYNLPCTLSKEGPVAELELKENEYIT